ncbi:MAG TPA: recombinase family protein, partial [Bdellovibrio sp.]|nr:recombinase family protein [Bdellovibrio sp.]
MQLKIAAYLRVSTEEQAQLVEGSLDSQKYRISEFVKARCAEKKDWGKIVDFYIDDGYSAKDTKRPAYQRMMADIRKGKVNLILVADLSRLSRNILDFSNLLDFLDKWKSKFLSMKEQFDTSTPAGKMMVFNMINLAQFEREQTSERVALNAHARAMRGLLNGGRAIMGYKRDPEKPGTLMVNEEEADIVKTIFK